MFDLIVFLLYRLLNITHFCLVSAIVGLFGGVSHVFDFVVLVCGWADLVWGLD